MNRYLLLISLTTIFCGCAKDPIEQIQQENSCTERELIGLDLRLAGMELSGTNFADSDLSGAIFSGMNLKKVDFTGANLSNANFEGATLEGAIFTKSNLTNASFNKSTLGDCVFDDSILVGSTFDESTITGKSFNKNFEGMNLSRVNFTKLSGIANFKDSNLSNANFQSANLEKVDFSGATMTNANFQSATLGVADFSGATLENARFESARLGETSSASSLTLNPRINFQKSNLSSANFLGATLTNANFQGSNLSNANFKDSTLSLSPALKGVPGISFVNTNLSNANFEGARLSDVIFKNAEFDNNNFTGSHMLRVVFSDCVLTSVIFNQIEIKSDINRQFEEVLRFKSVRLSKTLLFGVKCEWTQRIDFDLSAKFRQPYILVIGGDAGEVTITDGAFLAIRGLSAENANITQVDDFRLSDSYIGKINISDVKSLSLNVRESDLISLRGINSWSAGFSQAELDELVLVNVGQITDRCFSGLSRINKLSLTDIAEPISVEGKNHNISIGELHAKSLSFKEFAGMTIESASLDDVGCFGNAADLLGAFGKTNLTLKLEKEGGVYALYAKTNDRLKEIEKRLESAAGQVSNIVSPNRRDGFIPSSDPILSIISCGKGSEKYFTNAEVSVNLLRPLIHILGVSSQRGQGDEWIELSSTFTMSEIQQRWVEKLDDYVKNKKYSEGFGSLTEGLYRGAIANSGLLPLLTKPELPKLPLLSRLTNEKEARQLLSIYNTLDTIASVVDGYAKKVGVAIKKYDDLIAPDLNALVELTYMCYNEMSRLRLAEEIEDAALTKALNDREKAIVDKLAEMLRAGKLCSFESTPDFTTQGLYMDYLEGKSDSYKLSYASTREAFEKWQASYEARLEREVIRRLSRRFLKDDRGQPLPLNANDDAMNLKFLEIITYLYSNLNTVSDAEIETMLFKDTNYDLNYAKAFLTDVQYAVTIAIESGLHKW